MWIWGEILDAVLDCLKDLPFLFAAFFLMEVLEHHTEEKMNQALSHAGAFGPLAGALLGCIPQCGFSIMASNFFAGGVIGLGTLLAVYLSTSDEAVILLLSEPGHLPDIGRLILVKVIIGIAAGYVVTFFETAWNRRHRHREKRIRDLCENCGCHDDEPLLVQGNVGREGSGSRREHTKDGRRRSWIWKHLLRAAWHHTREVFAFLLIFSVAINLLLGAIGTDALSQMLLANTLFQPILASVVGLIPNCAASVLLTQLYLDGILSFGSAVAGLCSAAGLGLIVLFRVNPDRKESFKVVLILLAISMLCGILLQNVLG